MAGRNLMLDRNPYWMLEAAYLYLLFTYEVSLEHLDAYGILFEAQEKIARENPL